MKRVLLISNVRPGDANGRAEKFAARQRYLADRGWEVTIGHVPEPYWRSVLPGLVRCLWLARRHDFDVVNSVSNPFHLQVLGYLVSRFTGTPWLGEFRDPPVTNPDRTEGALDTRVAAAVERLVLTRADRVVWGYGAQFPEEYFESTYPEYAAKVTRLPFIGFDAATFDAAEPVSTDEFTITYAGSFYEGWIEPVTFLEGLGRYVAEHGPDLRVQFYGDWRPAYDEVVEEAGVSDVVETHGFVPHEEVVPVLLGSDALLYIGGSDPRNSRNIPSKIGDYIGARRPILALVDPDFLVADLIKEDRLGLVVHPDDPAGVSDALYQLRHGGYHYEVDEKVTGGYRRERKLAAYLDVLEYMVGE